MMATGTVHEQQSRRVRLVLLALSVLLGALMLLSLCLGRYPVSPLTALQILWSGMTGSVPSVAAWTDTDVLVVSTVRLPRVLVAAIAGGALGLSGATLQGLFRNPLVGPQVVGISNGAAWGGVVAILLGANFVGALAWTFGFAMLALVAVFALSRLSGNTSILSVVLAGIIVSAFFTALVGLAEFLADAERQLPGIVYWLLGSFATVTDDSLWVIGVPALVAGVPLLFMRWHVNVLSLGDETATALGLRAPQLRWLVLCLVAMLVTAQVSVSGAVGWVGLVVPHIARRLVGPNHQALMPASTLLGALYLLGMDDIARTMADQELPIGVLTALVGTPVFAVVFWRSQARGWVRE
jgi:iron complex transport system permease protein